MLPRLVWTRGTTKTIWRLVAAALLVLGLCCLLLAAWLRKSSRSSVSAADTFAALKPVAQIPLQSIKATGSATLVFRPRSTPVSRAWGEPKYAVIGRYTRNSGWYVYTFGSLSLDLTLRVKGTAVPLNPSAQLPYAYSCETCNDVGRSFTAQEGDEVQLQIVAREPSSLPEGELIVNAIWGVAIKDKIVGISLNRSLTTVATWCAWTGSGLVALGLIVAFCSGLRFRRHADDVNSRRQSR